MNEILNHLRDILAERIGDNTLYDFVFAGGVFLGLIIIFRIVRRIFLRSFKKRSEKTKTVLDDELVKVFKSVPGLFFDFAALYFALQFLKIEESVDRILDGFFVVVFVVQLVAVVQRLISYSLMKFAARRNGVEGSAKVNFSGLNFIVNLILWILGAILVLSNLGFNVTSLVASLGIGGIAVALAAQNILGDMFSAFSIYFDKPFEVGDFIVVGQHQGKVKKIGLKSTRMESIQGEEIIIPNKELTNTRIQNFKKMVKRRVSMTFSIVYHTDLAKMKKVNGIIEKIISGLEKVEFERCHFREFGSASLNFEVVYYVLSNQYRVYIDKQQEINFAIKQQFEKEGIEMAFLKQTAAAN